MADEAAPFDSPLGRAFARVIEDDDFAEEVRQDASAALAEYELPEDHFQAVVADAEALDVEVEGFRFSRRGSTSFSRFVGGLSSPSLLGVSYVSGGWTTAISLV